MKKLFKFLVYKLAKASGVEEHIQIKTRLELAADMETGARYFRDSMWKSSRAANAYFLFAAHLRAGNKRPVIDEVVFAVTRAAGHFLFEEKKEETTNG